MNISRKDFFRKSLLSLGEAVFSVKDALKGKVDPPRDIPDAGDFTPLPQEGQVAVAHNATCLAKNSGCFACIERCAPAAIKLIPGVGIRINAQLCNGCGACEYVCPVTPKAVRLQPRTPSAELPAFPADTLSHKGESSC